MRVGDMGLQMGPKINEEISGAPFGGKKNITPFHRN